MEDDDSKEKGLVLYIADCLADGPSDEITVQMDDQGSTDFDDEEGIASIYVMDEETGKIYRITVREWAS